MDVNWVHPSCRLVGKDPSLDFTLCGLGQDSVGDIFESDTVNEPHLTVTLEGEVMVNLGVSWWVGNISKGVWDSVVGSISDNFTNDELHDQVSVEVIWVGLEVLFVSHGHVLSNVLSEINDDFVTLSDSDDEIGDVCWLRKETSVGTDGNKGLEDSWCLISSKEQVVCSGNTSIQHSESVFTGLDIEEWVWETVDTDDVTVEGDTLIDWRLESSVLVEVLGSQHKGNIELTSWETELPDYGINQLVETSLSEVGIDGSDTDGVVVVPESTLGLTVRVVVVLELTWESHILGPTIPRSTRVRAVQMNGRWVGVRIDKSYNSTSTSGHLESVTWGDTSISSEGGGAQVGVDLKLEGGDVVLEEVNLYEVNIRS